MTEQPDNLFREKLEHLQLDAPARAWSRLEDRLDRSNDKGLWLKIAAGLTVFITAGVALWTLSGNHTNQVAGKTGEVQPEHTAIATVPVPEQEQLSESVSDGPATTSNITRSVPNKQVTAAQSSPLLSQTGEVVPETEMVSETELTTLSLPVEVNKESADAPSAVFLVYTAEEVNEKYLRKQPDEEATSAEKKSSRMQMLAGIAYNLKNGESGLGDLRHMKDEIFALNFLESKKEQSKRN